MQAFSTIKELQICYLNFKKYPNVIGIDGELQPRIKNHRAVRGTNVIRIYVSKKFPEDCFEETRNLFSRARKFFGRQGHWNKNDLIPKEIDGVPVDVVEMGDVEALIDAAKCRQEMEGPRRIKATQATQKRCRPLQAGISATHKDSTACTLNGLYREKSTGKLLIASNNHCFGREGRAKVGDAILQPSPYDGGRNPEDKVGEFYKGVDIRFSSFRSTLRNFLQKAIKIFTPMEVSFNRVDISFAIPYCAYHPKCDPIAEKCAIVVLNLGLPKGKRLPNINEKVQKVGRTTGKTIGRVVSTNWTGSVKYSKGSATFIDCILVSGKNFSLGGDSGSPVFDMNGNYIGALFAGSGDHSIICKYTNIELESGCELVVLL